MADTGPVAAAHGLDAQRAGRLAAVEALRAAGIEFLRPAAP